MAAIVVAALIATMAVLDMITVSDLTATLGRVLLVIAIATTAIVLLVAAARGSMRSEQSPERPKP